MYYKHTMLAPYTFSNGVLFSAYLKVEDIVPCWSVGRLMEIYDISFKDTETITSGEWPSFIEAKEYAKTYIEYLVDVFEIAYNDNKLDFSKLED